MGLWVWVFFTISKTQNLSIDLTIELCRRIFSFLYHFSNFFHSPPHFQTKIWSQLHFSWYWYGVESDWKNTRGYWHMSSKIINFSTETTKTRNNSCDGGPPLNITNILTANTQTPKLFLYSNSSQVHKLINNKWPLIFNDSQHTTYCDEHFNAAPVCINNSILILLILFDFVPPAFNLVDVLRELHTQRVDVCTKLHTNTTQKTVILGIAWSYSFNGQDKYPEFLSQQILLLCMCRGWNCLKLALSQFANASEREDVFLVEGWTWGCMCQRTGYGSSSH